MNKIEYTFLLVMIIMSSFFGIQGTLFIHIAKKDSLISIIISILFAFISFLIFIKIFNFEPKKDIKEKINFLFKKPFNYILNLLIITLLIINGITSFYDLNNFITSQYLTNTSQIIIGLLFILLIIYINLKDIKIILRVNFILIIINFLLFIIPILSLIKTDDITNFLPINEYGINNIIISSFNIFLINYIQIFILLIIPKNNIKNNKNINLYVMLGILSTIFIIFLIVFTTISNLGIDLTNLYQYPEYIVLKRINLFNFIDRLENIIEIQWIFSIFIELSLIIKYITITIKKNSKFINILSSFIIYFLSLFLFKNNIIFEYYISNIYPYIKFLYLLLFLIIYFKIILYNFKNNNS